MKNKIALFTLALLLSFSTSFAGTITGVDERIMNSFKKDFATAEDVRWEKGNSFVKATFTMSGQVMFAYYSEAGSLLALTRNITSNQLPIGLLTELKKNHREYWISDLFEIAMNNETAYYITLETGDYTLVMKSNGGSGWDVFKKERKEVL
jgi:hypothetical protein